MKAYFQGSCQYLWEKRHGHFVLKTLPKLAKRICFSHDFQAQSSDGFGLVLKTICHILSTASFSKRSAFLHTAVVSFFRHATVQKRLLCRSSHHHHHHHHPPPPKPHGHGFEASSKPRSFGEPGKFVLARLLRPEFPSKVSLSLAGSVKKKKNSLSRTGATS